jgi:hypothetical protein
MEDALKVASSPHDFKLLVAADGRTSTTMDDVSDKQPEIEPADPAEPYQPEPPVEHADERPVAAPSPSNGRSSAPPPGVAA